MSNAPYFYDPIYGYCQCGHCLKKVSNTSFHYLNRLKLKENSLRKINHISDMYCQCYADIFYAGKDFITVSIEESNAASKKFSSFKEGFQ
jgi:hypothetical protein